MHTEKKRSGEYKTLLALQMRFENDLRRKKADQRVRAAERARDKYRLKKDLPVNSDQMQGCEKRAILCLVLARSLRIRWSPTNIVYRMPEWVIPDNHGGPCVDFTVLKRLERRGFVDFVGAKDGEQATPEVKPTSEAVIWVQAYRRDHSNEALVKMLNCKHSVLVKFGLASRREYMKCRTETEAGEALRKAERGET